MCGKPSCRKHPLRTSIYTSDLVHTFIDLHCLLIHAPKQSQSQNPAVGTTRFDGVGFLQRPPRPSMVAKRGLLLLLLRLLQGASHAAGIVLHQHAALPAAEALPHRLVARALRLCLLSAMAVCVLVLLPTQEEVAATSPNCQLTRLHVVIPTHVPSRMKFSEPVACADEQRATRCATLPCAHGRSPHGTRFFRARCRP